MKRNARLFISEASFVALASRLANGLTTLDVTVETTRSKGCVEIVASDELEELRAKVRGLTDKNAELAKRLRSVTRRLPTND